MGSQSLTIVVMAKLPQAGQVKTRLCPPLLPEEAAAVHDVFVRETLIRIGTTRDVVKRVLCYSPPEAGAEAQQRYAEACQCKFLPQSDGDLGNRLSAVAAEAGRNGPVLFLGADTPNLPPETLNAVIRAVAEGRNVIGTSDDGGFWCLGLQSGVDAGPLFVGVDWSSGRECAQVIANARGAEIALDDAPTFADVDWPEDLARLWTGLKRSATAADVRLRIALHHAIGQQRLEQVAGTATTPRRLS